ncbi:MFS family permease [Bradyrhizobium sp. AZCC 2289]
MAGNLVGPLIGGILPDLIGIRQTFFVSGGAIFLAFLATSAFIPEERREAPRDAALRRSAESTWAAITDRRPVIAMLATALILMLANVSIEPIIIVYVAQLTKDASHITLMSSLVMSASAFASILAAPRLGRLADRIGTWKVVIGCLLATALLLIPQAFVSNGWQRVALRFLMGLALAGLLPSITSLTRHSVPDRIAGAILGYSTVAQYLGQIIGPIVGGYFGRYFGMRAVFCGTSALLLVVTAFNWLVQRGHAQKAARSTDPRESAESPPYFPSQERRRW